MKRDLSRLLRPQTIAVIGGGAWCAAVIDQLRKAEFPGAIWHVHPRDGSFETIDDLPEPPDAAFVGINRDASIEAIQSLNRIGAGGAVCFASGFAEVGDGAERNAALLAAAGDMPILGPNCYGMINALDGALLWPDQHGCAPVDTGVAILTQSSNIAINLTMQQRGLPIAYVITCGNQAQTSQAEIAEGLLDDPRVTAIGLHIEGFGDLSAWQRLARKAHAKGVPLIALKIGQSDAAQKAAISHTASLAGSDAGAQALLDHLGIARLQDLPSFLETLKLLHMAGPLPSNRIASISCSGGEASLAADMAQARGLVFPPLSQHQQDGLFAALGPKVSLSNPLDYHTYIWRDTAAMTDAFSAMIEPELALTLLIVDFPRQDRCDDTDWDCAVAAAIGARERTGGTIAMVATLPELMPETRAQELIAGGVIPISGLAEALNAARAAAITTPQEADILPPGPARDATALDETGAKAALAAYSLPVPEGFTGTLAEITAWANAQTGPFALKATGLAHKTEAGGVALNLTADALAQAAREMPGDIFLIERMVPNPIAELLIGIRRDPAHGFILTIGAGGTLTELLQDSVSLLCPATRGQIKQALTKLKVAKLLNGYRGKPAVNIAAILDAVDALQAYVLAQRDRVEEVEVNPLICTQDTAIAVDALIRTDQRTST